MRINKYIATSGLTSRRKAEELITSGKIKVNGKVVTDLATDIKETDNVSFLGKPIKIVNTSVYYKLYKPKGVVCSVADDKNRKTIMEYLRGVHYRVFPIGRLDYNTEGLLLVTNDGELSNIITKPNSEISKTYVVHIEGKITNDEIKQLSTGIDIGDYVTKPCSVKLDSADDKISKLTITITEGKNRQVRRMFEAIDKQVIFLKRIQIGEIRLGGLSRGEYVALNKKEMQYINSIKNK